MRQGGQIKIFCLLLSEKLRMEPTIDTQLQADESKGSLGR